MSSWALVAGRARAVGVGLLLASHLGLLVTFDLAAHPYGSLLLVALGFAGLLLFCRGLRRSPGCSAGYIILVALALRLLLLPLTPTLSDDVLRYVWDGRVLAAGFDPYELAPEAEELRVLRDPAWESVPHEDVPTVYPPLALTLFSIAAVLPDVIPGGEAAGVSQSVYVVKSVLALVDLLGCLLLLAIARRRGVPRGRVVAYAWNPLVTLEVAGMGHVDVLGVVAVIAAVYWLLVAARRPVLSAVAAGMGVLAKLVPVVAFPMWSRQSRRPPRWLLAALLTVTAGFAPVVIAVGGVPPGLLRYAVSWEFNGPLYEPLWRGLAAISAPEAVAWVLDGLKSVTGVHELWNHFYPYRYPQFLAKVVLLAVLAAWVVHCRRRRDPVAGTGALLGGVMLCSATFYPWYLLWVLPWAALCGQRAWLVLSALLPLSYLPQLLDTPLFPWYYLAIWAPFAALAAREWSWEDG